MKTSRTEFEIQERYSNEGKWGFFGVDYDSSNESAVRAIMKEWQTKIKEFKSGTKLRLVKKIITTEEMEIK